MGVAEAAKAFPTHHFRTQKLHFSSRRFAYLLLRLSGVAMSESDPRKRAISKSSTANSLHLANGESSTPESEPAEVRKGLVLKFATRERSNGQVQSPNPHLQNVCMENVHQSRGALNNRQAFECQQPKVRKEFTISRSEITRPHRCATLPNPQTVHKGFCPQRFCPQRAHHSETRSYHSKLVRAHTGSVRKRLTC